MRRTIEAAPKLRFDRNHLPAGFTVAELVVVVAFIVVVASMIGAGYSRTSPYGQAIQCLSNTRCLMTAWQMYADDHDDKIVPVLATGSPFVPGNSWVEGWLDWSTSPDNTNTAFLVDARYALLARYVNNRADIFKCPADHYLSAGQRASGWTQRVRSYSGNANLQMGNPTVTQGSIYRAVATTSSFQYPSAAETWIFLDEHPDSIQDGAFFNPVRASPSTTWLDIPATYHNGAASFSFADGHAEMHKWVSSLTQVRSMDQLRSVPYARAGDLDVHWMSYHTQRTSTNSY